MYVCMYVRMILSCHRSSDFISRTMFTKFHTSVQYGKTSNEFAFHVSASKVKVTVTILFFFGIALATSFFDWIWWNFTQVFSMVRSQTSLRFMMLHKRSRSLLINLENACHRSSYIPIAKISSRGDLYCMRLSCILYARHRHDALWYGVDCPSVKPGLFACPGHNFVPLNIIWQYFIHTCTITRRSVAYRFHDPHSKVKGYSSR
jgi:hypothetical protein